MEIMSQSFHYPLDVIDAVPHLVTVAAARGELRLLHVDRAGGHGGKYCSQDFPSMSFR